MQLVWAHDRLRLFRRSISTTTRLHLNFKIFAIAVGSPSCEKAWIHGVKSDACDYLLRRFFWVNKRYVKPLLSDWLHFYLPFEKQNPIEAACDEHRKELQVRWESHCTDICGWSRHNRIFLGILTLSCRLLVKLTFDGDWLFGWGLFNFW